MFLSIKASNPFAHVESITDGFVMRIGRERSSSINSFQARHYPRTDVCIGGVDIQAFWTALNDYAQPEVLQDEGEQKLQHSEEYGEENLQLQYYRELDDDLHGWATGLHCSVLLPGMLFSVSWMSGGAWTDGRTQGARKGYV